MNQKQKTLKDRGFILASHSSLSCSRFITGRTLRHISTTPQHKAAHNTVWACRSWDSHLVNESPSTSAVSRSFFGLPRCLQIVLSADPIIHRSLLPTPTELVLHQLAWQHNAPLWAVGGRVGVKGQSLWDGVRWRWATRFPEKGCRSWCNCMQTTESCSSLNLSSGSNGYASLRSEHHCPSPAALLQIHN